MSDTNYAARLRNARSRLNRRMALDDENLMNEAKVDTAIYDSEKPYRRLFKKKGLK